MGTSLINGKRNDDDDDDDDKESVSLWDVRKTPLATAGSEVGEGLRASELGLLQGTGLLRRKDQGLGCYFIPFD